MKNLDDILLEILPPVPNCEPKNNAATELRKEIKKKIEDFSQQVGPHYRRDMSEPYKPNLNYKEINLG